MTVEQKYELVGSIMAHCSQDRELRALLKDKSDISAYTAFEPSGLMDIAEGVQKCLEANKLTKAGCEFNFWATDNFSQSNNELSGDLERIKASTEYMIEVWKAVGMDLSRVQFLSASEEINKRPAEYWSLVKDIAQKNNLNEFIPFPQIVEKAEIGGTSAAQTFYPCMQCADIFFLKADIFELGLDEIKVNMMVREYCIQTKKKSKPVILVPKTLPSLLEGQGKRSKNDRNSTIFMEDSASDVNVKITNAFCPLHLVPSNPCIQYAKYIVFPWFGKFEVNRSEQFGGKRTYSSPEELIHSFECGELRADDLKSALATAINSILQPVRDHFHNNSTAKALLEKVKKYEVRK